MRALTPGVAVRHPVAATLPSMLQDDPFLTRFTAALDDVLVPLHVTLDCLDAYVDPRLAPEDYLGWLAGWVGLDLDERWAPDVRRSLAVSAASLHERRGTAAGLAAELALLAGAPVDVHEPGGVAYGTEPGTPLPGDDIGEVRVTVRADPSPAERQRLAAAARAAVPPHLLVTVEVQS